MTTDQAAAPPPDDDSDYETPRHLLPPDAYAPAGAASITSALPAGLFHAQDLIGSLRASSIPASAAAAAATAAAVSQRAGSADGADVSRRALASVGQGASVASIKGAVGSLRRK